jgi:hypothetical protein
MRTFSSTQRLQTGALRRSTESLPAENPKTPTDCFYERFRLTLRLSAIVSGKAPEGREGVPYRSDLRSEIGVKFEGTIPLAATLPYSPCHQ